MNDVLFSRAPEAEYVHFFSRLSDSFIKKGDRTTCLSFTEYEAYLYQKNSIQSTCVHSWKNKRHHQYDTKYTEIEILDILSCELPRIKLLNFKTTKSKLIRVIRNYLAFLDELFAEKKFSLFIMWNTSAMFDRASHLFARKKKIRTIVFENGYFRPFTLSVEKLGVNYENSVPRDPLFYADIRIDKGRFEKHLLSPEHAVCAPSQKTDSNKLVEYYFKIAHELFFKEAENQVYAYRVGFKAPLVALLNRFRKSVLPKFDFKRKYIFVPFQVEIDSQIIFFSKNLKRMHELVALVIKSVEQYNSKYNDDLYVVFKTHPLDYHLNKKIFRNLKTGMVVDSGDTNEYIEKSEAVITINSTVGIEALIRHKPVITLGDAFYNIEGLVTHCGALNSLCDCINDVLTKPVDFQLIDKFLYYFRFENQYELNWRNPDLMSINKLIDHIHSKFSN